MKVNKLHSIHSLVFDPALGFLATDEFNHRLQLINNQQVTPFPTEEKFHYPSGLLIHNHMILVCDSWNHRIVILDFKGTCITQIGSYGTGPGEFNQPSGIVHYNGSYLVADKGNARIVKLDESFVELAHYPCNSLHTIGHEITQRKQMRSAHPQRIYCHAKGIVIQTDHGIQWGVPEKLSDELFFKNYHNYDLAGVSKDTFFLRSKLHNHIRRFYKKEGLWYLQSPDPWLGVALSDRDSGNLALDTDLCEQQIPIENSSERTVIPARQISGMNDDHTTDFTLKALLSLIDHLITDFWNDLSNSMTWIPSHIHKGVYCKRPFLSNDTLNCIFKIEEFLHYLERNKGFNIEHKHISPRVKNTALNALQRGKQCKDLNKLATSYWILNLLNEVLCLSARSNVAISGSTEINPCPRTSFVHRSYETLMSSSDLRHSFLQSLTKSKSWYKEYHGIKISSDKTLLRSFRSFCTAEMERISNTQATSGIGLHIQLSPAPEELLSWGTLFKGSYSEHYILLALTKHHSILAQSDVAQITEALDKKGAYSRSCQFLEDMYRNQKVSPSVFEHPDTLNARRICMGLDDKNIIEQSASDDMLLNFVPFFLKTGEGELAFLALKKLLSTGIRQAHETGMYVSLASNFGFITEAENALNHWAKECALSAPMYDYFFTVQIDFNRSNDHRAGKRLEKWLDLDIPGGEKHLLRHALARSYDHSGMHELALDFYLQTIKQLSEHGNLVRFWSCLVFCIQNELWDQAELIMKYWAEKKNDPSFQPYTRLYQVFNILIKQRNGSSGRVDALVYDLMMEALPPWNRLRTWAVKMATETYLHNNREDLARNVLIRYVTASIWLRKRHKRDLIHRIHSGGRFHEIRDEILKGNQP